MSYYSTQDTISLILCFVEISFIGSVLCSCVLHQNYENGNYGMRRTYFISMDQKSSDQLNGAKGRCWGINFPSLCLSICNMEGNGLGVPTSQGLSEAELNDVPTPPINIVFAYIITVLWKHV